MRGPARIGHMPPADRLAVVDVRDGTEGRETPRFAGLRIRRREALAYGLTAAAFAGALILSLHTGDAAYLFFALVVLVGSATGGAGPAVLAALAGASALAALSRDTGWDMVHFAGFLALSLLSGVCGAAKYRNRRTMEGALRDVRAHEAHLQSILKSVPEAMIVIDEKGLVRSFSSTAERMFGYEAGEVVGKNVSMLMPPPEHERHNSYLERYRRTGEAHIIGVGRVVTGRRKDGSTVPIELAVGEMRSNGYHFFTGFLRDLTERQETETRLQELQSELVHMSRFTALGEMSSALAHELNQPLSAIGNYLGGARLRMERGQGNDPATIEALGKAAEQTRRAGEIIQRIRDFIARREIEKRSESVSKLVNEASTLALIGAKPLGIHVRQDLAPEAPTVFASGVQIQQVLVNLIRNAIEALEESDPGRRDLMISTRRAEHDTVEISVADTGPGLAENVQDRLFQPFVSTKDAGMGVGLSICRTIVEAHGGAIWAERNEAGGTIFRFTLPATAAAAKAETAT